MAENLKKLNENISEISTWLEFDKIPWLIAGPCSAESEEQVLATARGLTKSAHVKVFRAGLWKPRTRPNTFEGVGKVGLQWLKAVKAETSLLTTTEVANAHHVELCLDNDVDILWIGARTTVNPFLVQEIADALRGVDAGSYRETVSCRHKKARRDTQRFLNLHTDGIPQPPGLADPY
jgi:chorismate mutase